MKLLSTTAVVTFACFTGTAAGQSPLGFQPATNNSLGVKYGNTTVTPGVLLPENAVSSPPSIYLNQTAAGMYIALLVDLSIPPRSINTTGSVAAGLQPCRTTRLHWFQTDIFQHRDGSLLSSTPAIAPYAGPMPGLNDIPHTYAFYLFLQPSNFSIPQWDAGRNYTATSAYARMNFSIPAIQEVAGNPVAANFIRVQNPNNTATGSFSNGTCLNTVSGASNTTQTGGSFSSAAGQSSGAPTVTGIGGGYNSASPSASRTGSAASASSSVASSGDLGIGRVTADAAMVFVGLMALILL